MNLIEIFSILFIHWIADFVFQTNYQATNKSKSNVALTKHVLSYSATWYGVLVLISIFGNHFNGPKCAQIGWSAWMMLFPIITFIIHWITDYFTSRLNSKLAQEAKKTENWHNFFVSVGFDQVLHYIQLFTTYYLLKSI